MTASAVSAPLMHRAPLFAREAGALFRRRGTWGFQLAFLVVLLVVLGLFWPGAEPDTAVTGRWLFQTFAAIELAVAALGALALTGPAIALERERETLGLLAIAGAHPLRIVAGKALGRLAQIAVLVLVSLPLVGALFTVGGLSPREVGTVFVAAVALGALGAGLGSLFSATARRGETATIGAFLAMFLLAVVPYWLAATGAPVPDIYISPLSWYFAIFDPLGATGEVEFRRWWVAPLVHAGLGALALVTGAVRLGRRGYEPVRGGAPLIPLRRLLLRLRKRGGPLGLSGRFGTEVAALRWRERSVRHVSDGALAVAFGALILGFEVFVPQAVRASAREATAIGAAALATLLATVLGAAAVSRERDQKTIEPLAAAPIDADQFLLGKLLGLGRAVATAGLAVIAHVAVGTLRGDVPWATLVAIAGTIPFGLVLHAVVGLSLSCHAQTTRWATAAALAIAVVLGAVTQFGCFFYGLSPPAFVQQVMRGGTHAQLQSPAQNPGAWLAVAVFAGLLAAAVAVVAWNHLRARFDALIGRAALDIIELPDTMAGL